MILGVKGVRQGWVRKYLGVLAVVSAVVTSSY